MSAMLELHERNIRVAWDVVRDLDVEGAWGSIGAAVNLVGSLKTGLLMKHRDIDFHIYTDALDVAESYRAMAGIAGNPAVERVEYRNLIDTEEACIEWHAWCRDKNGDVWQIDMIHILRGSAYDGFAERAARNIAATLTPEAKNIILRLKYETPDDEKVMGIEYYLAVLRDGVTSFPEFVAWRESHPMTEIVLWAPEA